MCPSKILSHIDKEIEALKQKGIYRELRYIEGNQSALIRIDGRDCINLCSNNYLGLTTNPTLKKASIEAISRYGCGSGASRLIVGSLRLHKELELRLARFKRKERALLFNSGYVANLGIITALAGRDDIVFCDRLNHASIIDAVILSRAELKRYPHKDMQALEEMLRDSGSYRRRIIITDTVFSMDGDIAPLGDIVELARRYDALIVIDEAHATGVFGSEGRGVAEHLGLEDDIEIHMGTLSKALGGFGAYIVSDDNVIEYLINKSRPFIYTTSLPPSVVASSISAVDIVEKNGHLRKQLWRNVNLFKRGLIDLGFNIMETQSQIIPIFVGEINPTVEMSRRLFENGVFIQAIRPPTVPPHKCRLRATVMATHTRQHLEYALDVIGKEAGRLGII